MALASLVIVTGCVVDVDGRVLLLPSQPPDVAGDPDDLGLVMTGEALPEIGSRVVAHGALVERTLQMSSLSPASESAWAWSTLPCLAVMGSDETTSDQIASSFPEGQVRSLGQSRTTGDNLVVTIQVDRLTEEIADWAAVKPAGSVLLYPFIAPALLADCPAIAH